MNKLPCADVQRLGLVSEEAANCIRSVNSLLSEQLSSALPRFSLNLPLLFLIHQPSGIVVIDARHNFGQRGIWVDDRHCRLRLLALRHHLGDYSLLHLGLVLGQLCRAKIFKVSRQLVVRDVGVAISQHLLTEHVRHLCLLKLVLLLTNSAVKPVGMRHPGHGVSNFLVRRRDGNQLLNDGRQTFAVVIPIKNRSNVHLSRIVS